MLVPIDCAIWELHTKAKAMSRYWQTINHLSDLRKLAQGRNLQLFTGLPGPLADYTRTVGGDILRNRALARVGVFEGYEVDDN